MASVRGGQAQVLEAPIPNLVREFAFSEADFRHLVQLAYEYAGISLSESKRNLLYSRLSRRLRILGLDTFSQYRELLASDDREIENFINSISTNHTKFFREPHHFDHLRANVAAPFTQQAAASGNRRLRIWSAGCSSGEEPYTIAAVLKREIRDIRNYDVRILATDIDTDVLNKAARGEFATATVDEVPKAYIEYFKRGADKVTVDVEMKSLIAFRRLNLMSEPWPFQGKFDAIFCRNVMIYFDGPTKAKLIQRFMQQIKPGGWLYIGHSESLIGAHPGLQSAGRTIYRRDE
ncbi:MAG TPA: protein-glutamate O-methyltransferase CheR [Pseudolabrys sp.]|nr:protein-glutamate O-methyltransferase CheR [Pseudolabrys sp.]